MSVSIGNAIKELCTTVGAGDIALGGAASGYASFLQGVGTSPVQVYYSIKDLNTQSWEWGIGTFDGANTITRDTPRDVFVQGTYRQGSPDPVYLSGNSEVSCTFTRGAFEDLLRADDAANTYVPLSAAVSTITGTSSLNLRSALVAAYAADGGAYAEVDDTASVVTIGTFSSVPRPFVSVDTNYTIVDTNRNGTVLAGRGDTGNAIQIYVPEDANHSFRRGDGVKLCQWLFEDVQISPVSGVDVFPSAKRQMINNGTAWLTYIASNTWLISGDVEAI